MPPTTETDCPMLFDDNFAERRNMAWRVEPGRIDPDNPLLAGKYPWDESTPFYNGTVLKDPIDGKWKLWGINYPVFAGHKWGEWDGRMGYAESDDGVHWHRPMLDGFACMGREKSNVLFDFADGGNCFQMSVLVDPEAGPDRRYEMFVFRNPGYKNPSKQVKGLNSPTPHTWGIYRYFSPDGIHWTASEGPLDIESSDSLFVYRDIGAPYVAYHKMGPAAPPGSAYAPHDCGAGTIRVLMRRESEDGSHWSDPPLSVMTPDWRDAHDTQFMDLGPIRHGRGYVPTVPAFHALNQTMDLQFAGSPDGKNWFRPIPRVPCVPHGALGDCGGGHLFQSHRLVEDGDKLHVYYFAGEGLHSDLYASVGEQYRGHGQEAAHPTGGVGRATWRRGRLWSIVPSAAGPSQAVVTTFPQPAAGKTLFVNAMTLDDGEIAAELITDAGREVGPPVEGFERDKCRSFRGDSLCAPLVWEGRDKCPADGLLLRLYIRRARLHGFEWR